jgi:hypothetical protein
MNTVFWDNAGTLCAIKQTLICSATKHTTVVLMGLVDLVMKLSHAEMVGLVTSALMQQQMKEFALKIHVQVMKNVKVNPNTVTLDSAKKEIALKALIAPNQTSAQALYSVVLAIKEVAAKMNSVTMITFARSQNAQHTTIVKEQTLTAMMDVGTMDLATSAPQESAHYLLNAPRLDTAFHQEIVETATTPLTNVF